ncbi:MAG: DUF4214 domain-containing protein [Clostridiales bacterium]|nr:DUF4214 domain-containing protein [Clostridiales bacterium]MDY3745913.1 DUF4214 domain-containing protein [Lachnospiraceae bacterium]
MKKMKRFAAAVLCMSMIFSGTVCAAELSGKETEVQAVENAAVETGEAKSGADETGTEAKVDETEAEVKAEETETEGAVETEAPVQEVENEILPAQETEENIEIEQAPVYTPVQQFVIRLYQNVLNRSYDPAGLDAWTQKLVSKENTGAQVAEGFVYSKELKERNLSNSAYVDMLYVTFLDRKADTAGKNSWIHLLENGVSREYVLKGFVESNEFTKICNTYGIERGDLILTEAKDQNAGVTMFVYRCYKKILGRDPDQFGLNSWTGNLLSGASSADEVGYGFVFSQELIEKGLSNEQYVKLMYEVFLDRKADSAGLAAWVERLDNYTSRYEILRGFVYSDEFRKLCSSFGISVGNSLDPQIIDYRLYRDVLEYVYEVYDGYLTYSLFDIDKNGVKELIVKTGTCEADFVWEVVTICDDGLYYVDSFHAGHSSLSTNSNGTLFCEYGQMGYGTTEIIKMESGHLTGFLLREFLYESYYPEYGTPLEEAYVGDFSLLYR